MAQRKKKKEESEFLKKAREDVKGMSGIDLTLVDPLLVNLGKLYDYLDELSDAIDKDGAMIEKEVGTVNNRHMETVENPAFKTFTTAIGRAGSVARQISQFTKIVAVDEPDEEDMDEFDAFNA